MGRRKDELKLTSHESEALKRLSRSSRSSPHHAFRAKIVLHCAAGLTNIEVATKMRTTRLTVGKWRSRFVAPTNGRSVRRTSARSLSQNWRRSDRGGRDEDAGDDSKGKNSLEYALYGQTSWAEPFDDWTYLADVRASTAPLGIVSSLARPTTCRKGARRCWPVHEPTGQRGRPVRRREISDSSARTRPTRFADELGPARASDS